MPKNLVIVESPAKARTIERYLGDDYQRPGLLRPRPRPAREPGQGQARRRRRPRLRARVRRSPRTAASRSPTIEKAAKGADTVYLATDLDREGEAIAWHVAEAAHVPAAQDPPGDLQRDHRGRDPRRVRPPARDRPEPRRRPADAPDRRPPGRLHAQPAALAQGPRRPVGRPRPVGRRPPGRRARARDPRLHRPRVLDARGAARDRRRARRFTAELVRIDGKAVDIGDGETAERHADRASAALRPVVDVDRDAPDKRNPAPPFTTARSSRRRAASSASAPSGRCRSPSGCTRASTRPTATSA